MKKLLLLAICFLLMIAVHAQNQSVLAKDSTFISYNKGQTLQLQDVGTSLYTSDCKIQSYALAILDPITQQLQNYSMQLYDYYPDGMLYHEVYQLKYLNDTAYTNSLRTTYTYTASNAIASVLNENWVNNAWIPSYLTTYTYDAQGRLTEVVDQSSSGFSPLQNERRELTTYDANGHLIKNEVQSWNATSATWVPGTETLSTYGANGYLTTRVNHTWDTTGQAWMLTDSTAFYNNSNGQPDSSFTKTSDSTYNKTYYTRNSSTATLSQYTNYTYENNQVTGGVRYNYFTDSANYTRKDSTVLEFYNIATAAFALQSYVVNTNMYNTDHSIRSTASLYYNKLANAYSYVKHTYGYAPCSSVLPLTLLSFSGELKNNNAILHWRTTNEINTALFNIQRSADGVNFTTIGSVKAAGNSSAPKAYTYTDATIGALNVTKWYYRLATTSSDGSTALSKIVPISMAGNKLLVTVSPNPFTNTIVLNVPAALQDAKITISDMSGKVLYTAVQYTLAGKLTIDAAKYAKGMYVVTVQSAEGKQVFKIMK